MLQELTNEERIILLDNLSEKRKAEHIESVDRYAKVVETLPNSVQLFKISQKYFDALLETSIKVCDLDKVLALYDDEDISLDLQIDMVYYKSQVDKLNGILNYIVENKCDFPDTTKYFKEATEEQIQKEMDNVAKHSTSINKAMIQETRNMIETISTRFPKYTDYLKEYTNLTFNLSALVSSLAISSDIKEILAIKKELEMMRYLLDSYKLFIGVSLDIIKGKKNISNTPPSIEAITCLFKSAEKYDLGTLMAH